MKPKQIEFWSSTEYSGFLEGLMRELQARGFTARQRFQLSELSYRSAKSPLARLWLRVRQYLVYPVQLMATLLFERLFRRQADVCVVSTNTFYAPLLATFIHPNVVHLVYDLFPEAMIHSGKWREGSLKAKCVRWVTLQTLRRARQNVFLGQRVRDYVESIHGAVGNAEIIEVGADQILFESAENLNAETLKGINILYCGNFGNLHDSATLFQFWKKVAGSVKREERRENEVPLDFRWTFLCSGPKRAELIAAREGLPDDLKNQIQIGVGLGQSEWVAAMKAADIALVTMSPGSQTVVMPSKTYSAMMAGQAILAIAPEDSDLVDMIKASDCGWWVEPGDVDGLEKVLVKIGSNPEEILEKRGRAYRYAHEYFGQDALVKKWQALFETLVARANPDE
ncbi:MAG: glycosyltransferase involved in cell wall biosynthesis [Lentimonas sp.]